MRRGEQDDLLFTGTTPDLNGFCNARLLAVRDEVNDLRPDYLLNVSENDLCGSLVAKHRLDSPRLIEDLIQYDEPGDARIDVSQDWSRMVRDRTRPAYATGTRLQIHVPFEGNADLFLHQPNTFTSNPPRALVGEDELCLTFLVLPEERDDAKGACTQELGSIKQYLGWVRGRVEGYNAELPTHIMRLIRARKDKILQDRAMASSLGLPLRRREGAPETYAVPIRRKALRLRLPNAPEVPFEPEPNLDEVTYCEILDQLWNMAVMMERSPSTFAKLSEEELRNHFLVFLNAYWEGAATGETFNGSGKTDILIRHEGKNVFVAECKIWEGPKRFSDAISQLFSYVSWRDTKTALLIFNRNRNTSDVTAKAYGIVKAHPQFKRLHKDTDASRRCYIMAHPSDRNREVFMTVLVFDVPVPSASAAQT